MTVYTVDELIKELKKYPKDTIVASIALPFDGLEIRLSHYEGDNPKSKEFDFLAIDQNLIKGDFVKSKEIPNGCKECFYWSNICTYNGEWFKRYRPNCE